MKTYKRWVVGSLSIAILSASASPVWANELEPIPADLPYPPDMVEVVPISAPLEPGEFIPISLPALDIQYASFTGTVQEINVSETVANLIFYRVVDEAGNEATLVVSEDTYLVDDPVIEAGTVITGFYDMNAPMLMIYPPQYSVDVLAVQQDLTHVKVDRFDENLLSSDGNLKLNLSEETKIELADGTPFEGDLTDRMLVVIYGATTRSLPPQTSPERIVVLEEKTEPAVTLPEPIFTGEFVVNNKPVAGPAAFQNDDGVVMVPLRALAEALDLTVTWDEETRTVQVGENISLTIGADQYAKGDTAELNLGSAPVIIEDRTFVPLSFFKAVADFNNAYVFEGQIVIDNEEVMN